MIITIDGPTASGKGSIAKAIAAHKGYFYLDTGMLYRALGYMIEQRYSQEETRAGAFWSPQLVAELSSAIEYSYSGGSAHVAVNGKDITAQLRTPIIDWYASHVSSIPVVRAGLRALQQDLGKKHAIVIDGRDCGTVIFPHADHKFFITAALPVRVQRAHDDAARQSASLPIAEVARAVLLRDMRDLSRPMSPLQPAADAIILDTTMLSKEASIALVLSYLM